LMTGCVAARIASCAVSTCARANVISSAATLAVCSAAAADRVAASAARLASRPVFFSSSSCRKAA
jgi:hypothetical protein